MIGYLIIFLIIATTITKNSTKKLDKEIFEIKENIRILEDRYEFVYMNLDSLPDSVKVIDPIDIFCDAMISIRKEIEEIERNRTGPGPGHGSGGPPERANVSRGLMFFRTVGVF